MTLRRVARTIHTFLRQRSEVLDFSALPDPRDPRGQRWSHDALLGTALLSLMLIARSLREAERISQDLAESQKRRGICRRVPDSTLGDVLAREDPKPLRRHLHRHVLAEHRRKALEPTVLPIRAISIDGKTVATLDAEENPDCQKHNPEGQPPYWLYRVVRATMISWESDSSRGWVKRQLWRTTQLAGWGSWSHLRQVWLVRVLCRDKKHGAERVLENRLYVTNLPAGRLSPEATLALVRAHWRIEGECFGRMDIEWQEDHGRWVRRGNGLPVVSLLRVLAYNLLSLLRASHLSLRGGARGSLASAPRLGP